MSTPPATGTQEEEKKEENDKKEEEKVETQEEKDNEEGKKDKEEEKKHADRGTDGQQDQSVQDTQLPPPSPPHSTITPAETIKIKDVIDTTNL